ncbi:PREDICTED: uncharacterized protein LOC109236836 [Nicotiana attenuata]|uniref:uncharacterized protein LOC109236836 n=1 Tax=Nicotiana attenuata TaxID=49451 RepID=UPI0009054D8F|nr:PREDICTED: uncharacterized protein LOC109236836 [Nicotiana attenuata]
MIIGGTDIPQEPVIKRIKITAAIEGPIRDCLIEDTLDFSEEDFGTLTQSQYDALAISFLLNSILIRRVLVDPGSSANVIRSKVIEQLGLLDQIVPASRVLHGFDMAGEITKGEISLSVDMSGTVQNTKFHVIGCDMRYNALLGKRRIHSMRALPSTLHQMTKYPTKDSITTIYGEQHAAKEMCAVY